LRDFSVYDLEWDPRNYRLRVAAAYDEKGGYRAYFSIRDFMKGEFTATNTGRWMFAHFGGGADINFILPELVEDRSYKCRGATSGSSLVALTVRRGAYVWHLLDSFWLLRAPLDDIGESVGMEKLSPWKRLCGSKCQEDCRRHAKQWYAEAPLDELIIYNKRDCEILYAAISRLQATLLELGGTLRRTAASCAMDLFRRRYLTNPIRTYAVINEYARKAYHASRVEPYRKICGPGEYWDINSSFPYAMTFPQPGNYLGWYSSMPAHLMQNVDETPFMVDVDIDVPDMYLPPLPYRTPGGSLFFPTGKWRAWLDSTDYALALECGVKMKVHEVWEFEPFYDMADYANDLYALKAGAKGVDPFLEMSYKLGLNSMYGKTAERGDKETIWINPSEEALARMYAVAGGELKAWHKMMKIAGVWIEPTMRTINHEHVVIAMHVTAIARRTHYRYLSAAVPEGLYYGDTDSIFTPKIFKASKALGGLKHEAHFEWAHFAQPKLYSLLSEGRRIVKAKGYSLSKDAAERAQQFDDLVAGLSVNVERMRRVREALKMVARGEGGLGPMSIFTEKNIRGALSKRKFTEGGDSRPWTVDEITKLVK
jgi:hypothetical protein